MSTNNMIPNLGVSQFMSEYSATPEAILIDARTPGEVAEGAIEGAINIDFLNADFQTKISKLDTDKTYFVYCRSGQRSMNACKAMSQIGIKEAINLKGGYMAYQGQFG